MPFVLVPVAASGVLRFDWVDPTGTVRDLTWQTSPSLHVSAGAKGLGAPPVELVLDKLPSSAGSAHRYTQTGPAEIDLPIIARGDTFAALMATVESLREWFDTGNERAASVGYLRITRPHDDAVRQIACLYAGGLEGDLQQGGPQSAPLVVSLLAPDPYWTDTAPTENVYGQADLGDDLSILNLGDFDAYPIWTIQGPASAITITNTTTGKSLALTADGGLTLGAADALVIDTRPPSLRTNPQVYDPDDGTSFYSKVAAGGALWWFTPGQNHFTIAASGATGGTSIVLQWLPRYRGALR